MGDVRMLPMPADSKPPRWPPGGILRTEHDGVQHLVMCPCGCGKLWHPRHRVVSGSTETGDLTLDPSLVMSYTAPDGKVVGCGWHGWLKNGVFTSV